MLIIFNIASISNIDTIGAVIDNVNVLNVQCCHDQGIVVVVRGARCTDVPVGQDERQEIEKQEYC